MHERILYAKATAGQRHLFDSRITPEPDKKHEQPKLFEDDSAEGRWITLRRGDEGKGVHVFINAAGQIQKGPSGLTGKSLSNFASGPSKADHIAHLRNKEGRPVGPTTVHLDKLTVDPQRFQYKISNIDPRTGVSKGLKDVKQFHPMLGGQLLVWEDPEDHKTYVINGHHRYELAKRSPQGNKLDVVGNIRRAKEAESAVEEFDRRSYAAGSLIAKILDESAERLFHEPRQRTSIQNEALDRIRAAIEGSDSEGMESSVRRVQENDSGRGGREQPVHAGTVTKMSRVASARLYFMGFR